MTTKKTFYSNMDQQQTQWLVIGVSGVTCGGKTTLANNLLKFFRENPSSLGPHLKIDQVHLVSQDNYFLPVDDPRHVLIEHLNHINWEIISSIDMERMCQDVMELLGANFLFYPTKQQQTTTQQQDELMHVDDNLFSEHHLPCSASSTGGTSTALPQKLNILIIEGFLIFNHTFTLDLCNIKFHVHLPYERCYERRQKRRYEPPDVLGYFEMVVWPLYDKHCKEFAKRRDIMYLNGEVARDKIFNFVLNAIREQL
ncbi:nicotinamide riboside kinase 1 [Culicoides brevitarsis]|uniref:nicotinamide riboside kinase 1 n=1 Tax=Culicoides brevitarsis TaxID=469753 RepID=UPI00307BC3B9